MTAQSVDNMSKAELLEVLRKQQAEKDRRESQRQHDRQTAEASIEAVFQLANITAAKGKDMQALVSVRDAMSKIDASPLNLPATDGKRAAAVASSWQSEAETIGNLADEVAGIVQAVPFAAETILRLASAVLNSKTTGTQAAKHITSVAKVAATAAATDASVPEMSGIGSQHIAAAFLRCEIKGSDTRDMLAKLAR